MQANGQFTLMNPPEAEVLAFDFTTQLAAGDSVDTALPWTCTAHSGGQDPNAQALLTGSAQKTGNIISQMFNSAAAVPGVTYAIASTVTTVDGNKLLLWATLTVKAVGTP